VRSSAVRPRPGPPDLISLSLSLSLLPFDTRRPLIAGVRAIPHPFTGYSARGVFRCWCYRDSCCWQVAIARSSPRLAALAPKSLPSRGSRRNNIARRNSEEFLLAENQLLVKEEEIARAIEITGSVPPVSYDSHNSPFIREMQHSRFLPLPAPQSNTAIAGPPRRGSLIAVDRRADAHRSITSGPRLTFATRMFIYPKHLSQSHPSSRGCTAESIMRRWPRGVARG